MKSRDRSLESTRNASRTLTLLASCVLVTLALITLSQTAAFQPVQAVLEQAVAPLQRAVTDGAQGINSWVQTANAARTLQQDNATLQDQIAQLQTENARLRAKQAENDTLRTMLGFQIEKPDLQLLPASVIGRDPSGLSRMLTLDRGSADGVREGMAVTSPGGVLLGKVRQVTPNGSTVLLIDDIDSSISATVDRTNLAATVQGQAQHGGRLLVLHLAQGGDVARGDLLKTSGLGGTLPRGLLVGQIYEVHQKDIDQEQEALAYPLAIPETVSQVLVVLAAGAPSSAPRPLAVPTAVAGLTATPGLPGALYPVPPTATPVPTHTPVPTSTPMPTPRPTSTPRKR
ncbi:MAG TPA: rod shape-determining protein MreC [Chloroflexia bacterium]|nr:rod shape-determining protein MreC [Chloroflexia bacterium]